MSKQTRRSHRHASGRSPVNERALGSSDSSNRASGTLHQVQLALGNRGFGRFVQAKLKISQPGDAYEQEADRVADQVMRMPNPRQAEGDSLTPATLPLVQRACDKCEAENEEKEIQRKAADGSAELKTQSQTKVGVSAGVTSLGPEQFGQLSSAGEPLMEATRTYFEPRFGYDLSEVRVHADPAAAAAARSVNALAFTVGRDIVFDTGRYNPNAHEGKLLLAHELAHVIQQRGESSRPGVVNSESVPFVARRASGPIIQRRIREGHDHGGRYEIDDQACTLTYHQNWYFTFQTDQSPAERTAYMEAAQQQIQDVWSNKFPLIPDREGCPCYPHGLSVAVLMHPFNRNRQGRGFTIIVTPTEERGFTNPPTRRIDLGTAHETPVPTEAPGGQRRVAHEFGHTIGLTDEYNDWAGLFHTEASRDTPSIMHDGDEVRPRHYQHFADLLSHDLGEACNYSPEGHRLFAYENPPVTFRGLPFSFAPWRPDSIIGIAAERRLGNEAFGGLAYPTAGAMAIINPRDRSVRTGPTVGASLSQLAHPLYVNVRTGLLFDPERPGVSLPLSVDLGIRHDRGFQVGINYTAVADLLNSGGWTHLVGLGLEVELP